MNNYLIPANSKKSQLILSLFTVGDLILFGSGIAITVILLLIVRTNNLGIMILAILPALITGILVLPIPNYHNVLGFLQGVMYYYSNRRQYYWRGWCVKHEYGRDNEN